MNFLIYIEHSAENLQFYLWYCDYVNRFSELPESDRVLSPPWSTEQVDTEMSQVPVLSKKKLSPEVAAAFQGTDFDPKSKGSISILGPNPFNTPPRTPRGETESLEPPSTAGFSDNGSTLPSGPQSYHKSSAAAFDSAQHLQPCMPIPILLVFPY